jgi:hypothetical protein
MAASVLDEMIARVTAKPAVVRDRIIREARHATKHMRWVPNPGPQTDAYLSKADILLYGGEAGGGKSHLVVGWGVNEADNGIIFRRELAQTDGLEAEGKKIIGATASFNGQDREWTWSTAKTLKLGGMKAIDDWIGHAGRERDYIGVDEGGEFAEIQIASIMAWLRAAPGKRTRLIIGSNPPRTSEGQWLLEWFAPWLDDGHELYPTEPGKLLWAIYVGNKEGGGKTIWVDGPGTYEIEGEEYTAKSRTFIPAGLEDNPYRNTPEYRATLQSLPEPLRSQLLYGDWKAGMIDQANQCIPTDWVDQAIARWKANPKPPEGVPMCAIGVDAAGGGKDQMVQAPRFDAWFAELIKTAGKDIPKKTAGSFGAGLVLATRRDGAVPVIDLGGGYGSSMYEHLQENDIECHGFNGAEATPRRSRDGKLKFVNKRAAAYWSLREALDPSQPGGSDVALPPDTRLRAGLTAPTFEVTSSGIKLEPKVIRDAKGKVTGGVMAKLGWSPDEADATVMSWWEGPRALTNSLDWAEARLQQKGRGMRGTAPQVIMKKNRR